MNSKKPFVGSLLPKSIISYNIDPIHIKSRTEFTGNINCVLKNNFENDIKNSEGNYNISI